MTDETARRVLSAVAMIVAILAVSWVARAVGDRIGDDAGTTYEAPDPGRLADDLRELSEETYR